MEMKRNVKAILRIEKDSAVEEIVNDIQNEYLAKGVTKNEFAKRVLAGEFEDIFDENIEAFMRKSKLRLLDDDRRQEIARVEMTDFCAEDICYFISNIAKVIGNISDEYAELFNMLDLAGFNYSADGFMLPNLMYIDDLKVHSESCSDISITFDAIISAAKLHPNTAGTSKVIIALGSLVAVVGGIQTGVGFKDDNADGKTRGFQTLIGGAIIAAVGAIIPASLSIGG